MRSFKFDVISVFKLMKVYKQKQSLDIYLKNTKNNRYKQTMILNNDTIPKK